MTGHKIDMQTPQQENLITELPKKSGGLLFWFPLFFVTLVVAALAISGLVFFMNTPPSSFEADSTVSIETGESVKQITARLEEHSIVRSGTLLYLIIAFLFEPENIKASTYVFEEPLNTYDVAKQLTQGEFDNDLLRFTHIEGERATAIAKKASFLLPNFDEAAFLAIAEPNEGRLFPDTYLIPETYTAKELADLMIATFEKSTEPLRLQILESSLSRQDIIILASIIEREANSPESMKMVSSILQNRLEIDMPLQADASIEYVLDKPLEELTPDDLKIESPYNTYTNTGLPPTAIGNPGLAAIEAVLMPTESDYFYYITDSEGIFHYSKTYREHLKNVELYLR